MFLRGGLRVCGLVGDFTEAEREFFKPLGSLLRRHPDLRREKMVGVSDVQ